MGGALARSLRSTSARDSCSTGPEEGKPPASTYQALLESYEPPAGREGAARPRPSPDADRHLRALEEVRQCGSLEQLEGRMAKFKVSASRQALIRTVWFATGQRQAEQARHRAKQAATGKKSLFTSAGRPGSEVAASVGAGDGSEAASPLDTASLPD